MRGLKAYLDDMEMCCRCSCCKFIPLLNIRYHEYAAICPSIERFNFHCYSAGGRLNIGAALAKGQIVPNRMLEKVAYSCFLCGGCQVSCSFGMDMHVFEPILELRFQLARDGFVPQAFSDYKDQFEKRRGLLGTPYKGQWAREIGARVGSGQVYLYIGCLIESDPHLWRIPQLLSEVLRRSGLSFTVGPEDEPCCGAQLYQMGFEREFVDHAERLGAYWNSLDVRLVVAFCSHCYWALKVLLAKYGVHLRPRILHVTEFVEELLQRGELYSTAQEIHKRPVTYHDPCKLGRLSEPWIPWQGEKKPGPRFQFVPPRPYRRGTNGVYQAPRRILSYAGVTFLEMPRTREYAWCCGSGGGIWLSDPELATWVAEARVREAKATGAEILATACPWCRSLLSKASAALGNPVQVLDVLELLFH